MGEAKGRRDVEECRWSGDQGEGEEGSRRSGKSERGVEGVGDKKGKREGSRSSEE